jgi:mycothiol synthase
MTTTRYFRPGDLPALVELRQAVHPLDHDDQPRTLETVRHEMEWPGLDPVRNVFIAESNDGRVVGMAKVLLLHGNEDVFWCYVTAHPDVREGNAGPHLLQAIWDRVLARRDECGGRSAWLQSEVHSLAAWQVALLQQAGASLARYSLEMLRPLIGQDATRSVANLPPLVVPEGIALQTYRHPQDNHAANAAINEAFRDHWASVEISDEQRAYGFDSGYIQPEASVVARADSEVVGACYNDFSPLRFERTGRREGYVDTLCVRRPWRRRGVATAMLAWTLREAAARGLEAVSLGMDAENPTGAKQLYERIGFREVERFHIYRKQIPIFTE